VEHTLIDPAILYFGTPVALLSTIANDGTTNTAPMSSIFWLGQTAVLGMGARSQTAQNLLATGECVRGSGERGRRARPHHGTVSRSNR
jgi:flavin reductase (DIM6/NTAB) family NADH-FMN oxidoreductase RutF